MRGVMIAIESNIGTSWTEKKYFNLWCELGRFLLRQSHICNAITNTATATNTRYTEDKIYADIRR